MCFICCQYEKHVFQCGLPQGQRCVERSSSAMAFKPHSLPLSLIITAVPNGARRVKSGHAGLSLTANESIRKARAKSVRIRVANSIALFRAALPEQAAIHLDLQPTRTPGA